MDGILSEAIVRGVGMLGKSIRSTAQLIHPLQSVGAHTSQRLLSTPSIQDMYRILDVRFSIAVKW